MSDQVSTIDSSWLFVGKDRELLSREHWSISSSGPLGRPLYDGLHRVDIVIEPLTEKAKDESSLLFSKIHTIGMSLYCGDWEYSCFSAQFSFCSDHPEGIGLQFCCLCRKADR